MNMPYISSHHPRKSKFHSCFRKVNVIKVNKLYFEKQASNKSNKINFQRIQRMPVDGILRICVFKCDLQSEKIFAEIRYLTETSLTVRSAGGRLHF